MFGEVRKSPGGVVISALGISGLVIHVFYIYFSRPGPVAFLAGSFFAVLVASLTVYAGYWLSNYDYAPESELRVVSWSFLGLLMVSLLAVMIVVYQRSIGGKVRDPLLLIANGAIIGVGGGFLLGVYDVESRKRLDELEDYRESLEKEKDKLSSLFENTTDAIAEVKIYGEDPVVREVNTAFEDIFGYGSEEIVGESLDEFLVPPELDKEAKSINRRAESGDIVETEVQRETQEGVKDFIHRAVPHRPGETGSSGYAVYTDITERKKRERRLGVLNRVLRHDIRNNINVIHGNAELLEHIIEDGDIEVADERETVEKIKEKSERIHDLSEKAREVEKVLERGKSEKAEVDVVEAVKDAIEEVERDIDTEDVEISFEGDIDEGSRQVYASGILRLAFENLVQNSVEHNTNPSSKTAVSVSEEDGSVVVRVADNGPGIPENEIEVLDEGEETDLKHASGLGLWVVNWIVTESDAELEFEENDPQGTVAVVRIPKKRRDDISAIS